MRAHVSAAIDTAQSRVENDSFVFGILGITPILWMSASLFFSAHHTDHHDPHDRF
jgi:hypothetical protein